MGTLGKAAGVAGAFVAAHPAVIETLVADRAVLHLHDRRAAAPRRGAAREPSHHCATTRRATRTSRRWSRASARGCAARRGRSRESRTPIQPLDRRRQRGGGRACRRALATRLLGAGHPPADGAEGNGAAADHAVRGARARPTSTRWPMRWPSWRRGLRRHRRHERGVARRVGRRGSAARAAARMGDAFGNLGAARPELARRYRVHAVDLPGHGHSRARRRRSRSTASVAALAAALASRRAPLTVLGWSLGGLVAMRWALAGTRRASQRLALVARRRASSPPTIGRTRCRARRSRASATSLHVAWKLTVQRFLALQMHGSEHGARDRSPTCAASSSRAASRRRRRSRRARRADRDADLRTEVGGIEQPALVISGGRDTLALPAAGPRGSPIICRTRGSR